MGWKRILLLILIVAAVMQTHAADGDDDNDNSDDNGPPPSANQKDEGKEAETDKDAEKEEDKDKDSDKDEDKDDGTSDDGDDEDDENKAPTSTTSTAVLEQTDTTMTVSEGTPPPPSAPEDSYYLIGDDNKICVAIKLEVMLEFIDKNNRTENRNLQKIYPSYGDCGDDNLTPRLTIVHDEDVNFTFAFEKDADGDSWQLTSMELQFNPSKVFKNDEEPSLQTLTPQDVPEFKAPIGDSYYCNEPTKVNFYKSDDTLAAYAVINSIRMQAYDVPAEFGSERMCPHGVSEVSPSKRVEHRSDTAPIAVGLTMAILTLFGVTGFAVHRIMHQKKVDYSNM